MTNTLTCTVIQKTSIKNLPHQFTLFCFFHQFYLFFYAFSIQSIDDSRDSQLANSSLCKIHRPKSRRIGRRFGRLVRWRWHFRCTGTRAFPRCTRDPYRGGNEREATLSMPGCLCRRAYHGQTGRRAGVHTHSVGRVPPWTVCNSERLLNIQAARSSSKEHADSPVTHRRDISS